MTGRPASIAVVHRARLLDGRMVAVKVLRPGIEHLVATDLDLMQPLLEILVRQTGDQMAGSTLQLLDGLPRPDRRGDGPAQRGAGHVALPTVSRVRSVCRASSCPSRIRSFPDATS